MGSWHLLILNGGGIIEAPTENHNWFLQGYRARKRRRDDAKFWDRSRRVLGGFSIERRPDGRWIRDASIRSFASDGSVAILDEGWLCFYAASGKPIRMCRIADTHSRILSIAWDTKRVIAATESQLLCFNPWGALLWQTDTKAGPGVSVFITRVGILNLCDGVRRIMQYSLDGRRQR